MSSTDFSDSVEDEQPFYHALLLATRSWLSRGTVRETFLRAIKRGATTAVLDCLAQHPTLLAHNSFGAEGDTVWHLLAEFGDAGQLQALVNFIKIHGGTRSILGTAARSRKFSAASSSTAARSSGSKSSKPDIDATIHALVNVGNNLAQTPLMFAAYHGRDDVVVFLMKQGADPWLADRCGRRTALHYACMKGHAPCVRAILDAMTPEQHLHDNVRYVDVPTSSHYTPLHFAVAADSVPTVRALLAWDAKLDSFNIWDAGEFWISCEIKSTPLHVAAASNRVNCAMAILRYYADNKDNDGMQDPRCWCDCRGRTPARVAKLRGHVDLAAKLSQKADIEAMWGPADLAAYAQHGAVPKLQVLAAAVVQAQLQSTLQELEDYMKLLGTYQQHGRVFARVAYNVNEVPEPSNSSGAGGSGGSAAGRFQSGLGGSGQGGIYPISERGSIHSHDGHTSRHSPATGDSRPCVNGASGPTAAATASPLTRVVAASGQMLKSWLDYGRRGIAVTTTHNTLLSERSKLALQAEDVSCFTGVLAALGLRHTVYVAPQPGEDICGVCQDNKPYLEMRDCGHRICLLCAKRLCHQLELQQLVTCPYCDHIVYSFILA